MSKTITFKAQAWNREALGLLSTQALIDLKNQLSEELGGKTIKTFHDKTAAVSSVWASLETYRAVNSAEPEPEPAKTKPKKAKAEKAPKPARAPKQLSMEGKRPNGRRLYTDTQVIKLKVTKNPKRTGTAAWIKFDLLRNGMTVGEYRAFEQTFRPEDPEIGGFEPGWADYELRYCEKVRQFIEIK